MLITRLVTIAATGLVLLFLLWQLSKPYPMPEPREILPPQLPQVSHLVAADVFARIRQRNIWAPNREALLTRTELAEQRAVEAAASEGALTDSGAVYEPWRLLGVSREGAESLVVIDDGRGIKTYRLGETLPDGSEIVNIMPFGVELAKAGERNSAYLFGRQ